MSAPLDTTASEAELRQELLAAVAERDTKLDDILAGVPPAPAPDWGTIALATFVALLIAAIIILHSHGVV